MKQEASNPSLPGHTALCPREVGAMDSSILTVVTKDTVKRHKHKGTRRRDIDRNHITNGSTRNEIGRLHSLIKDYPHSRTKDFLHSRTKDFNSPTHPRETSENVGRREIE